MDIVGKIWGYCNTLRHDGINYGDYIEQLTYLLFLKIAEENQLAIPADYNWQSLKRRSGVELLDHYIETLRQLSHAGGLLGDIFSGALSRFREPTSLKKLISLIDEVAWSALDADLKGEIYEGLLQKFAAEQKGAGQYFTPRPLIRAIVHCIQPLIPDEAHIEFSVHDPAAGTGGFLIGAAEWMLNRGSLSRRVQQHLATRAYSGVELVQETRRLCLMNIYLQGLEGHIYLGDSIAEKAGAGLYDVILTNPPFGTKGAGEVPERDDFTVATSNKQLNFVQHVLSILKRGGRAAMVLPDNVLFEGGAGRDVRRLLMEDCQLHTILRLPVGTFTPYAAGVKANVLFFRKGLPTDEIWFYDARTNFRKVTKRAPLTEDDFVDFVQCYGTQHTPDVGKRRETERFQCYTRQQIAERDDNLDIFWLRDENLDDPTALPEPEDLLGDILSRLTTALDAITELNAILNNGMSQEQA